MGQGWVWEWDLALEDSLGLDARCSGERVTNPIGCDLASAVELVLVLGVGSGRLLGLIARNSVSRYKAE